VPGLPRERSDTAHPPRVRWQNGAKVAVRVMVTTRRFEKTFAMGDQVNDGMYELPFAVRPERPRGQSMYEYGRVGIWRMLILTRRHSVTFSARRWL
jgi:hypothetical protein